MERKHAFDAVADQYDAIRPGYPAALVARVMERVPSHARLLEIGCGTAIATLPYARRGHRILCLEPGANLAAIARRKLAPFPRVEVIVTDAASTTCPAGGPAAGSCGRRRYATARTLLDRPVYTITLAGASPA